MCSPQSEGRVENASPDHWREHGARSPDLHTTTDAADAVRLTGAHSTGGNCSVAAGAFRLPEGLRVQHHGDAATPGGADSNRLRPPSPKWPTMAASNAPAPPRRDPAVALAPFAAVHDSRRFRGQALCRSTSAAVRSSARGRAASTRGSRRR
eukprot:2811490-Prymnesium_polylepis.1